MSIAAFAREPRPEPAAAVVPSPMPTGRDAKPAATVPTDGLLVPPDASQSGPRALLTLAREAAGTVRLLARFGRRHWRAFACGSLAAAGVVAGRLALPWPLRAVNDRWLGQGGSAGDDGLLALVPAGLDPVLAMGTLFLAVMLGLGLADFLERLWFARFALSTVGDLREAAFAAAMRRRHEASPIEPGEVIARLIGDAARIKSGMQAFLVHVATNGAVFLGVTVILFAMDPALGLIFAAAATGTALATGWGAARLFRGALKRREKEGRIANRIMDRMRGSGEDDGETVKLARHGDNQGAAQTRTIGVATWTSHVLFGLAVLAALLVGADAVAEGRITTADLLVLMMYALLMRGPIVRLARQGSKSGKSLGTARRLVQLANSPRAPVDAASASLGPAPRTLDR
jgi:ATP-binding cassette subfamily B protein